jgi:hypothetical protein
LPRTSAQSSVQVSEAANQVLGATAFVARKRPNKRMQPTSASE